MTTHPAPPEPRPPVDERAAELLATIAPYPWRECGADRGGCQCGFVWDATGDACIAQAQSARVDESGEGFTDAQQAIHARFIAAAPSLVRDLLAALTATRAELARVAAERDALTAENERLVMLRRLDEAEHDGLERLVIEWSEEARRRGWTPDAAPPAAPDAGGGA